MACARTCTFDEKFNGADAATNDKLDAERGCLEADYSEAIAKRDKTINSHFVHFSDICENLDLKTTEEMKSLEIEFSDKCAALVQTMKISLTELVTKLDKKVTKENAAMSKRFTRASPSSTRSTRRRSRTRTRASRTWAATW